MPRRILAIGLSLVLSCVGLFVFLLGSKESQYNVTAFGTPPGLNWGAIVMVAGAALIAASVIAARWSVVGLIVSGLVGVVIGALCLAFPLTMTRDPNAFAFAPVVSRIPYDLGINDISEPLMGFLLPGTPLALGAILVGIALGLATRGASSSVLVTLVWSVVAAVAAIAGLLLLFVSETLYVEAIRVNEVNPLQGVVLVFASLLLALAGFAVRGAARSVVIIGAALAALALVGLIVLSAIAGATPYVSMPRELFAALASGYPILLGLPLAAAGVAARLRDRNDRREPAEG